MGTRSFRGCDVRLYRFEKLEFLEKMLTESRIFASHPSQWPDPYESTFLVAKNIVRMTVDSNGRVYSDPSKAPSPVGTRLYKMGTDLGAAVFGICFTTVAETERMWQSAWAQQRVCWEADSDELSTAIRTALHPSPVSLVDVTYKTTAEVDEIHRTYAEKYASTVLKARAQPTWFDDVTRALSTKREAFSDEREQRIVISHSVRDEKGSRVKAERIPIRLDVKSLIRRVVLHPSSTDADVQSVRAQLASAGFVGEVSRSPLYKKPNFDVKRYRD